MARRRGRPPKSALNTATHTEKDSEKKIEVVFTEEKVETPEMTPEVEEVFEKSLEEELPTVEEVEAEEVIEEEVEYKPPVSDYPDRFPMDAPEVEEEKVVTKEDLKTLSKAGLRYYQRTGRLPRQ